MPIHPPSPDEEALQSPFLEPSDLANAAKAGYAALKGAIAGLPFLAGAIRPYYHGTAAAHLPQIQKEGLNLRRFGQGDDHKYETKGWFGKGVYLSENPEVASVYGSVHGTRYADNTGALLEVPLDDKRIFDFTKHVRTPTSPQNWHQYLDQFIADSSVSLRKEQMRSLMMRQNHEGLSPSFFRAIQGALQKDGFQGARFSPNEVVVYDTKAIGKPSRTFTFTPRDPRPEVNPKDFYKE